MGTKFFDWNRTGFFGIGIYVQRWNGGGWKIDFSLPFIHFYICTTPDI